MVRVRERARRFRADNSGQALVEFAMVMPLLVGLFIGIIELGQAWRSQQVLTHATREATRLAIVPASTGQQVTDRIKEVLVQGGLDPSRAQLTLALRGGTGTSDTVKVQYPQPFPLLGPALRLMGADSSSVPAGSVQLSSTFVMRNE